ncbi:MAG: response regulator transcription factor [Butyrivibrio sp.]|nr:response regulator transcription factor [Butyrivibrio sp.]MBP3274532.1 response regulator transcription factor [Butyrivibrio sp.]
MHLAVCDDNIADRKQTERLLGRQSDRIFKECGERIYIDSFGNVEAFLHNPQMYHGLFIDMVQSPLNGFEVLKKLLEAGITRPIIMCTSSIDYKLMIQEASLSAPNIFYLDKPIKVAELTAMVDMIKETALESEPTIELRTKDDTLYAKGDDIVCVKKVRSELEIYLADGRTVNIIADIVNFYDECNIFRQLCPVNDNAIININHISKVSFGKVLMDNGVKLPISFTYRNSIKQTTEYVKEGTK